MSKANDYRILMTGRSSDFYRMLQELWIYHKAEIEKKRDMAASRGNESAWRYWAGQEAGFVRAITALDMAIADMEKSEVAIQEEISEETENILKELRLKKETL